MNYKRVAVVIVKNEQVLLMHRIKKKKAYYCFPGGKQDPGESPEQTAIREIKEETGLDIVLDKALCEVNEPDGRGPGLYYLCTEFVGTPELGGPEKEINCEENQYRLEWIPLANLSQITLYPQKVVDLIASRYNLS